MSETAPNASRAVSEDEDLGASLSDLAALVSSSMSLDALLGLVATYAVTAIPNADGVGICLVESAGDDQSVRARAASSEFAREIDDLQYTVTGEGPCITAAHEGRVVRSGNISADPRWPHLGSRVGRLGVHSVLSLPLLLGGHAVGAINAYAHGRDAFDERAAELGRLFAAPAAVAVHNASVLDAAQTRAQQLQAALLSRPVIDQAIGIIRARSGGSSDEAFAKLRTISQNENVKLNVVAQRVVDEAVRRAHARHVESRGLDA